MRNEIVIIFSQGVFQPPGISRFGNGVSQLSPLRPALGNGDPLIEILRNRNALSFERVLQRPAPSHLWIGQLSRPLKSSLFVGARGIHFLNSFVLAF